MATVLIVDDSFEDLESMHNYLKGDKHEVATATNGAQALDLIQNTKFDLILVDIKMPTLSGYDLMRLLREKLNSDSKIIYVSILKEKEVMLDGVDGFIQKPLSEKDFVLQVKKALEK
ncbi:MAG: response regulator [Candidatus Diapherotrites archaeon]|nr:response regulator [Candidatus Diapherotrites archaeon]